jgi:hypothetical protein
MAVTNHVLVECCFCDEKHKMLGYHLTLFPSFHPCEPFLYELGGSRVGESGVRAKVADYSRSSSDNGHKDWFSLKDFQDEFQVVILSHLVFFQCNIDRDSYK